MNPGIEIAVVWQDVDLIEVLVRASSQSFAGEAAVYTTDAELEEFSSLLGNFPRSRQDSQNFAMAASDTSNRVHFSFRTIDGLGHSVAIVSISDIENSRESAVVVVPFEPGAVDRFVQQLRAIAATRAGSASLLGTGSSIIAGAV